MKRLATATTILLVVSILGVMAIPAARAEDEPKGDSPAERAYRDAWWAETSTGALDRALDGYRKASEVEGPAAVRAKALYRMAVVLERIGKTDEAIRAMEQLAKDFPDEGDLLAKARDRLEEWTAVDLRTDFASWYERYKYSPEFQGRIVELVLKLGGASDAAQWAAQELLIIGQAAAPALQAHLDSPNAALRGHAVDLLLKLGVYPPARHVLSTSQWQRSHDVWRALLAAPEAERRRLATELEALDDDSGVARALGALLQGRSGWARAVRELPYSHLIRAILQEQPGVEVLEGLCLLVPELHESAAGTLASYLLPKYVSKATANEWLQLTLVRNRVADLMQRGECLDASTWKALVDASNALPVDSNAQRVLFQTLVRALGAAEADADLTPAVRMYERVAPSGNVWANMWGSKVFTQGGDPGDVRTLSRFLVQVADEARDPTLAKRSLEDWARLHRGDEDVSERLVAWTLETTAPLVARAAATLAGQLASDRALGAVIAALGKRTPEIDGDLIGGLRGNRRLLNLAWGDERVLKLHAYARAADGTATSHEVGKLFSMLHRSPERLGQMTRLALKVPRRVWRGVTRKLQRDSVSILSRGENLAALRSEFQRKWPHWPLEDRIAAVRFFRELPVTFFADDELQAFLRTQLAEQMAVRGDAANEELEREIKAWILEELAEVSLADVRRVFDTSTPEGALYAWATKKLPFTLEVWDSLAPARKAPDAEARRGFLDHWRQKAPEALTLRALRAMVIDADPFTRQLGITHLATYRRLGDVHRFVTALTDDAADVRLAAAEALAGVYDEQAIKALATALDDPDPEVRDRVLATLETIKQIEEKKQYWKDFAEGER